MVARGGALNLVGAITNGLFQFLLVVAVSQVLTRSEAGAFWEAVALFLILNNTCMLGADTGLTRMIPRYRVQNRIADIRASLDIGIGPALVAGLVFGVVAFVLAQPLSELFTNYRAADASMVADYIRIMAVFLPIASAYMVAIAATRGFGTMMPNALIDRIGKSGLQFIMVVAVVLVAVDPSGDRSGVVDPARARVADDRRVALSAGAAQRGVGARADPAADSQEAAQCRVLEDSPLRAA